MNDKTLMRIIGCLACFDMKTGRLLVFEKAQMLKIETSNRNAIDFRVIGEQPDEKEWLLITHNALNISRVKKEHVDVI